MEKLIENAIRETLVISNPQSIQRAVTKIMNIINNKTGVPRLTEVTGVPGTLCGNF